MDKIHHGDCFLRIWIIQIGYSDHKVVINLTQTSWTCRLTHSLDAQKAQQPWKKAPSPLLSSNFAVCLLCSKIKKKKKGHSRLHVLLPARVLCYLLQTACLGISSWVLKGRMYLELFSSSSSGETSLLYLGSPTCSPSIWGSEGELGGRWLQLHRLYQCSSRGEG